MCSLLAASGDTVFAADADARALRRLPDHEGIVRLRVDVTSDAELARARRRVESLAGDLDGLVCCAGIFRAGALVEVDADDMAGSLAVNLLGAFRVVREFFPLLLQRRGTVVLVGTEMSRCARPSSGAASARTLFAAQHDLIRRMLSREWEKGMEPDEVARVAVRALHAPRPRAVYRVGNDPARAMLARLPATWVDALIRAFTRLRVPGARRPQLARRATR